MVFGYRAITFCGSAFQADSPNDHFGNSLEVLPFLLVGPTTPQLHRRQAVPQLRFRLVPFRSPLLRESRLLSFPRGTEMFQFPRFPPAALCVQAGVTGHDPSRVSPFGDPRINRLVGSSPWLFAASHVLHRHLAPRHPPLALCSFAFHFLSTWRHLGRSASRSSRCSCSLCSSQGAASAGDRHGRATELEGVRGP
jgi:hypothetical protein